MPSHIISVRGMLAIMGNPSILNDTVKLLDHRARNGFVTLNANLVPTRCETDQVTQNDPLIIGCLPNSVDIPSKSYGMIHGSIYGDVTALFEGLRDSEDVDEIRHFSELLMKIDGSYSFIIIGKRGLIAGRDIMGTKPLYIGRGNGITMMATEVKPFLHLSLNFKSFPPGSVCLLNEELEVHKVNLSHYHSSDSFNDYKGEELVHLLEQSVERRVAKLSKVALSFSGGIDSSIIAKLAMKHVQVLAITVGVRGSLDSRQSRKYAELLDIDLLEVELEKENVRKEISRIGKIAEVNTPMDISIASGFYFASQAAMEQNYEKMFVGQLADELFGGYSRYLRTYCEGSDGDAEKMMAYDVTNAYKLNFERDEKSTSPHIDLEIPYSSIDVVRYGLTCPVDQKLHCDQGIRKVILRKAARMIGLPEEIASRPKKAIQYSSGLYKVARSST